MISVSRSRVLFLLPLLLVVHTAAVHGRRVWAFVITTEDASDRRKQITLQSREILVVADELVGGRLSLRGQVVHLTARHADSLARHRLHIRLQSSGVKLEVSTRSLDFLYLHSNLACASSGFSTQVL